MEYAFTPAQLRKFADQIEATQTAGDMGLVTRIDITDPDNNNMQLGYISFDGDGVWGFIPEY